ncbi:MAG TPA: hypothetical protein VL400_11165 [Polyangiaceae bacterium]|jgi:hypothetical protein|nr:hypothetical protein [Polyangiaceae bacterium]
MPTNATTDPQSPTSMKTWLDTLATKRDELRLHVHLAGMDLGKEWSSIEARLRGLSELELSTDEARLQLHLAKMEAKQELSTLADQVERIADETERAGAHLSRDVREAMRGVAGRLRDLTKRHRGHS